jgi:hypothetical protein
MTSLMTACSNRNTNIGMELLNHDMIRVNAVDDNGDTALIMACFRYVDDMDVIHWLYSPYGAMCHGQFGSGSQSR